MCNHQHLQGQLGQRGLVGGMAAVGDGKVVAVEDGRQLAAVEGGRQGQPVIRGPG